jgi:hypothetical protein
MMPVAWCAVTSAIIASGLTVPLEGGPQAGFGYMFVAAGHGDAFMQGLALYSAFAAGLGIAFMFVPKLTSWRIRNGLAWSTFMLMAVGGTMMLVAPQALLALARSSDSGDTSLALAWSVAWIDAGTRLSLAGGLVGLATFVDARLHRQA